MNILFLTMGRFDSIEAHSIYADLLRCFRDHGHEIYTITPYEKKTGKKTELVHEKGAHVLHIETGNVTGASNLIKKGIAQISIEHIYIKAIKNFFDNVKFDLVMYSTPPITFCNIVEYVKKSSGAKSYLLLKDIFPQNAVDLGMMSKNGIKGFIYKYFRKKEKKLYFLSDHIGCMSKANVKYVIDNNPEIDPQKVEICSNSIEVLDKSVDEARERYIREKYGIPLDKTAFVFGGNLGKPQGIPFLIDCIRECIDIEGIYFLIVGSGSDFCLLKDFLDSYGYSNVKLLKTLPKEDYDAMVGACDVGLIFLNHSFTIPNFPSRLLAYMQAKIPVLACTDTNTDIGEVIVENEFGWWCESNNTIQFRKQIENILKDNIKKKGENGFIYLNKHYNTEIAYNSIVAHYFSNDCESRK